MAAHLTEAHATGPRPETIMAWIWDPMAPERFVSRACISSSVRRGRIEERTFEIEFLDPGVQAFSFTFG